MGRFCSSFDAPQLLPLILLLQVKLSSAHPYAYRGFRDDRSNPEDGRNPQWRPHHVIAPSVTGIQTTSWSTVEASAQGWWTTYETTYTISQIADGQIQAPYHGNHPWALGALEPTTVTSWATDPSSADVAGASEMPMSTSPVSIPFIETNPSQSPTNSSATPGEVPLVTDQLESTSAPVNYGGVSQTTPSAVPDSALTSLTTSEVQSATVSVVANTTGSVHTSLETSGNPTLAPFPTSIVAATSTLDLVNTSSLSNVVPTNTANLTSIGVSNIFQPMATDAPPAQISSRSDHPALRTGIQPQPRKLETNKFYANLFLDNQDQPVYTFPYSITWANGRIPTKSYGMSITHIEPEQLAQGGPNAASGAWNFFAGPVGIQSIVISAAELQNGTRVTTDTHEGFSVNANLAAPGEYAPLVSFPLVQGMGYVTSYYRSATPTISSGVGISSLTFVGAVGDGKTFKYRIELANQIKWLAYITPNGTDYNANTFTLTNQVVQGTSGFSGVIQIAKIPLDTPDAETVYDRSAGAYPTTADITGSVDGTTGSYTLSWSKGGSPSQSLLMYALPHHMQSFSNETLAGATDVRLFTTTKGNGTAILADSWTMVEQNLPIDMDFAPWRPGQGSVTDVSDDVRALLNEVGTSELSQNITMQTDLDSMYYSGKGLAKFAAVNWVLHDMADNVTLALTGLQQLETAFARFIDNEQEYPLVYDEAWGGVVSIGTYLTGNSGIDFGNSYYNDHHFHYGYFVYAAAVIAYLDPTWLANDTNKAWVNMLIRDYANPCNDDPYFPFSRSFDWYHGHSWAAGLFASTDGKNQESSSEDTMASYAIKMWGHISGDLAMEARGNLMLSVQKRSLDNYYLMTSNNTVEPAGFIGNKASGILFENKIDHTTYFGSNTEYVEGIHMIPLMPFSTLIRTEQFVQEEWDTYFADYAANVTGGWRGILEANNAIIDPDASLEFFADLTDLSLLDGGASQTWYLAWAAGLGGQLD